MVKRRHFLGWLVGTTLISTRSPASSAGAGPAGGSAPAAGSITLFLCGDVMTGRGIDQILPFRSQPRIREPYLLDARDYLALAERRNGPIPRPVPFDYIWGDALDALARARPDARIINLETAITTHDGMVPKGINYRMHPGNTAVLNAAGIDCCSLANNHVLDWGREGLSSTLTALRDAGIHTAGAGHNLEEAQAPAIVPVDGRGRVLVFAFGSEYSGVGRDWGATATRPGIDLLPDLSNATVDAIGVRVRRIKRPGDIAVASIHWGGNWGYEITEEHRQFAHGLIDRAGIDVLHGHSSHHVKGIEVYRQRPVIYGCGDLVNDYEGINGYDRYRPELGLMYFPTLDAATGQLIRFDLIPTRLRRFRIQRATAGEADWLRQVLEREGRTLGTRVVTAEGGGLEVGWENR